MACPLVSDKEVGAVVAIEPNLAASPPRRLDRATRRSESMPRRQDARPATA